MLYHHHHANAVRTEIKWTEKNIKRTVKDNFKNLTVRRYSLCLNTSEINDLLQKGKW